MLPPVFPKQPVMVDRRWTVQDKIRQYKGLVKLSERDAKILQTDTRILERKQIREYRQLKTDTSKHREELNNAVRGDQQHYRNVLSKNKFLMRTFQNHSPEKTIPFLEHKNFIKRKLLDRLHYKTENKLRELVTQKLTCSELQDNLLVANITEPERMGEILAGKVREATIKLEAALQIKHTYKQILGILKKDKLNFDFVLNRLMEDACHQSRCIYKATQIGQLAIEYTDDRKQELEELRHAVKRDMKSRFSQVHVAERQVQELRDCIKLLVRKESTPKVDKVSKASVTLESLHQDLQSLEIIFQELQNVTYTSKFEDILPCLNDRERKSRKMIHILRKNVSDKETLLNKINHAKSVYSHLINTTEYSTFEYMQKKVPLKQSVKDARAKAQQLKDTLEEKSNFGTKMLSVLLHLQQLCRIVNKAKESKKHGKKLLTQIEEPVSDDEIIYEPQPSEMDAFKVIADLETRLPVLINDVDDEDQIQNVLADINAQQHFRKFIAKISSKVPTDEEEMQEALIIEIEPKDVTVLTSEFIKKRSRVIVEQNAKPDWMV